MISTLTHTCGGSIALVLEESRFFCISPTPIGNEVRISLGEIGKFKNGKLSVVKEGESFTPSWTCLRCSSGITRDDCCDVVVRCTMCSKKIPTDKALSSRGYSSICPDCYEKEKESMKEDSEDKKAPFDTSIYAASRKRGDTYTPVIYADLMFNPIVLRNRS